MRSVMPKRLLTSCSSVQIVLKKWYTIYKDHVTLEDYGELQVLAGIRPTTLTDAL